MPAGAPPNAPKTYWGYSVAPGADVPRDASAAAITAYALLELSGMAKGSKSMHYLRAAEQMVTSLSSPAYKALIGTNGGFILTHSTGNFPSKSEIDVPLSYADYYYVEALMSYKQLIAN